ncbi:uncharacterized protein L3040_009580 [Drepanopeziza brunnea f. sp. 'multigermtubi']|uniref:uncharacterized protein n=1 Tax=Drepanopeziza brunnea f. sp. 'multigermtubi' TaxID=698441 RepID=UPI0023A4AF4F|nr:hypothetical protein L3040_009580 [Drepanopeziza brunnea f. sp. 'multigermtubi']
MPSTTSQTPPQPAAASKKSEKLRVGLARLLAASRAEDRATLLDFITRYELVPANPYWMYLQLSNGRVCHVQDAAMLFREASMRERSDFARWSLVLMELLREKGLIG